LTPEEEIINTIGSAVDKLANSAAAKQNPLFDEIVNLVQRLKTANGALLNSVDNLKIINDIKNKIERFIIDKNYKDQLKDFAQTYTQIAGLQNQYFASFNAKFKPINTLQVLTKGAVASTLNNLTEAGINTGVIDGINNILLTNIQQGASMADMTRQLREEVLGNKDVPGSLHQYIGTYATTAINQFSAEYNKSISDDLGLEWYSYTGSLLTTSRPFCINAVAKRFIHISEFNTILHGDFGDLGRIHVNKKTHLPDGLMEGTTPDNFQRRRGGWNCGHQILAVPSIIVPQDVKDKVFATSTYVAWALEHKPSGLERPTPPAPPKPPELTMQEALKIQRTENAKNINKKNKKKIEEAKKAGFVFDDELMGLADPKLKLTISSDKGGYYRPHTKELNLPDMPRNDYAAKTLMLHEGGHAMHFAQNIITDRRVDLSFRELYGRLNKIIEGKEKRIHLLLKQHMSFGDASKIEQVAVYKDILGSLTKGLYGGGHSEQYYQTQNNAMMEVFAHAVELYKGPANMATTLTPELQQIHDELVKYISKFFE
jgi:hypothetical protein